jgi:putative transposase
VGVREVFDHIWLISFVQHDLGFFDDTSSRVECAPNPFSATLPMCPERTTAGGVLVALHWGDG